MNPKEFLAKRRAHIIFVVALLLVVGFIIALGLATGRTFADATWSAFTKIRPMDYLMFALFWYACAVQGRNNGSTTSFISLNLSASSQK